MPLRVFTQHATQKRQRICTSCFQEMEAIAHSQAQQGKESQARRVMSLSEPTDEDSLLGSSAAYPYSDDVDTGGASRGGNADDDKQLSSFLSSATIHCGMLDFFHGSGFRKNWHQYFFVLLIRKGSLGMFLHAQDHIGKKKRPAAVYKLSGYSIRVKSQKRRPHQFHVSHPTKKVLHFAATSIEEMNAWISPFIKAIDVANELEALAPIHMPRSPRESLTSGSSSPPLPEHDFTEDDDVDADDAGGREEAGQMDEEESDRKS